MLYSIQYFVKYDSLQQTWLQQVRGVANQQICESRHTQASWLLTSPSKQLWILQLRPIGIQIANKWLYGKLSKPTYKYTVGFRLLLSYYYIYTPPTVYIDQTHIKVSFCSASNWLKVFHQAVQSLPWLGTIEEINQNWHNTPAEVEL